MTDEIAGIHTERPGTLTTTEEKVADLWREVLQIQTPIQAADSFFALGGDSLAMTMVLFRIQETFGIEMRTPALVGAPELGLLAALIDSLLLPDAQTSVSNVL